MINPYTEKKDESLRVISPAMAGFESPPGYQSLRSNIDEEEIKKIINEKVEMS